MQIDILRKIGKHPNIVELFEIYEDREYVILVSWCALLPFLRRAACKFCCSGFGTTTRRRTF